MSQIDKTLIRDADLLDELEKARDSLMFKATLSFVSSTQQRRDTESATQAARAQKLAAMARDTRHRAIIREVIENTPHAERLAAYSQHARHLRLAKHTVNRRAPDTQAFGNRCRPKLFLSS